MLEIPSRILIWSAIGSIACVLYRLFTKKSQVNLQEEIRWLIARPFLGIIMGSLSYLAIKAGLVLLGETSNNGQDGLLYAPIAFVAGFSDKFYEKVIDVLVGRVASESTSETSPSNEGGRAKEVTVVSKPETASAPAVGK